MRVRVIAVGTRMPVWVKSACEDYLARLAPLNVSLQQVEAGSRGSAAGAARAVASEAKRLLGSVRTGEHVSTLLGHTRRVWSVDFAPDGDTLVSSGDDGTAVETVGFAHLVKTLAPIRRCDNRTAVGVQAS